MSLFKDIVTYAVAPWKGIVEIKANKEEQKRLTDLNNAQIELAKQAAGIKSDQEQKNQGNTTFYIIIGVVLVVIVGLVFYFKTKKK